MKSEIERILKELFNDQWNKGAYDSIKMSSNPETFYKDTWIDWEHFMGPGLTERVIEVLNETQGESGWIRKYLLKI